MRTTSTAERVNLTMRILPFVVAITLIAGTWQLSDATGAARCSYFARYPSAIGRHTFMLATATAWTVRAPLDKPHGDSAPTVPAQVMAIVDVAGYQSEVIRTGLRGSNGTAVFIRYRISASCAPIPAPDGAFDSVGVNGLYVGAPRPSERWIDGRPTFDVFEAPHLPLPQRLSGPSGHVVAVEHDGRPTMTAAELFAMYRALWAESVSVGDTSVGRRIGRWLEGQPLAARKQPAEQVATDMLSAVVDARIAASPIPYGGIFAITVVVPGVDSLVMYGKTWKTWNRARPWRVDVLRDSATAVPVAMVPRSFAIDVTTAMSLEGLEQSSTRINQCAPIPIIFDELPIVPGADSTWRGEMWPTGFLECAPPGSALAALTRPEIMRDFSRGSGMVIFRRHPDGRVTFEMLAMRDGSPGILVRGERVSAVPHGAAFE